MTRTQWPEKVISGGQTGVDLAALDAALELGIPIGGWCPGNRRNEEGPIPDKYPLVTEVGLTLLARTHRNVDTADGTLILSSRWPLTGGTLRTRQYAERKIVLGWKAPDTVFVADPEATDWVEVARWAARFRVLNVAGPRESKQRGIYTKAKAFLLEVLR